MRFRQLTSQRSAGGGGVDDDDKCEQKVARGAKVIWLIYKDEMQTGQTCRV